MSDPVENGTLLSLGPYRMRVDVEKTRAWYRSFREHYSGQYWCDCSGCRNMELAFHDLPEEVSAFFSSLGVDPLFPAHTSPIFGEQIAPDASNFFCDAWYHIAGELLEGDTMAPVKNRDGTIDGYRNVSGESVEIEKDWDVSFKKECFFLKKDFPRPCFQMQVYCTIPWLLDEPNPFIYE